MVNLSSRQCSTGNEVYKNKKLLVYCMSSTLFHVYSILAAFSAQQGTGESVEAMWRPVW